MTDAGDHPHPYDWKDTREELLEPGAQGSQCSYLRGEGCTGVLWSSRSIETGSGLPPETQQLDPRGTVKATLTGTGEK